MAALHRWIPMGNREMSVVDLILVIVGSLGYYGVKGGVFTIVTGGTDMVWGPNSTFKFPLRGGTGGPRSGPRAG